jgi:hypothetical protein
MALMFQMFGTLQKEQLEFLRAELDRVQDLTREIQALQLELKGPAVSASGLAVSKIAPLGKSRSTHGGTPPGSVAKRDGQQAANLLEGPLAEDNQRNGTDVHALLCERMAELQEDRRSRMQKMVDFLSGK